MTGWEKLVERYKDDRQVCNCRHAWYTRIGEEVSRWTGDRWVWEPNQDPCACHSGCQNNLYRCMNEIGERIAAELGI
jgi:hypothetical protein